MSRGWVQGRRKILGSFTIIQETKVESTEVSATK